MHTLVIESYWKLVRLKYGDTEIANRGQLTDRELTTICAFIKKNHIEMFMKWEEFFGTLIIKGEPGVSYTAAEGELKPISFADMIKNKLKKIFNFNTSNHFHPISNIYHSTCEPTRPSNHQRATSPIPRNPTTNQRWQDISSDKRCV